MLDKEHQYYLDNIESIKKLHLNKFIAIKNNEIIGTYDTRDEAITKTLENHEIGTFLIQQVVENDEDITIRFTSRISIEYEPNEETYEAMNDVIENNNINTYENADDMFDKLGI